ncbi:MAG: bifunctional transaldolase/phosoglucose isomerase [Bacteroidetes bacterium]|nr:bifunctional transaldolase/phosoglucose isomerase [Bacteroidota bacterium]
MSKLNQLAEIGQSIWYDYIRRQFITGGELKDLIDKGLRGITSNPSIFEKAIAGSNDYDEDLKSLIGKGLSTEEIYEKLAFKDIELATDLMLPVYEKTNRLDGYVSIEVSPKLAHLTDNTIEQAKRIFALLNKPNVMIKVPATEEGLPAISELIGSEINVNVTLIFNIENYKKVAEAYLNGLELLLERNGDLSNVTSVASFFISRIDVAADKELDRVHSDDLKGKIAIANAKNSYLAFQKIFSGDRWNKLKENGATVQRLLWASTGTKNPLYPDTLYVDSLIGNPTVNTLPPTTFTAFLDHGKIVSTLDKNTEQAIEQLEAFKKQGIDLDKITNQLQKDGVQSFAKSFENIMIAIKDKIERIKKDEKLFKTSLGNYQKDVDNTIAELKEQNVIDRIWAKDYTVWGDKPHEITNRLGWLKSSEVSMEMMDDINEFVEAVKNDGLTNALLLGMGGSSLAPEVFRLTFGVKEGYLDLAVLDSTHPESVLEKAKRFDPEKTLYIVSTKSGGTVETLSFMKFFYNQTLKKVGKKNTGEHFIAITDPGSKLEQIASQLNFRKTFLNDPDIGGRYSALSLFGVIPAALIGVDLNKLLDKAAVMVCNSEGANCPVYGNNTPAILGCIMGKLADSGRDKITFITSNELSYFGAWVEQLIAESTGKNGKGILPVVGEEVTTPEFYSDDRLFIYLHLINDKSKDAVVQALKDTGHPVVEIMLKDIYELGGEYFRWEMATAIAGWVINIQPFDQPNVEAAKILAKEMLTEYLKEGKIPQPDAKFNCDGLKVFTESSTNNLNSLINELFGDNDKQFRNKDNRYVTIQSYLKPDDATTKQLQKLRTAIQKKYKSAVTVGYGPRFLHSTGQLHKGDAGNGVFIQIISRINEDAPIPNNAGEDKSNMAFGVLITSQAFGDRQALLGNKRKVISFQLETEVNSALENLIDNFTL